MDNKIIRKIISLKIDPQVWIKAKVYATSKGKYLSEYIEELIKADLKRKQIKDIIIENQKT